jgi:SAM-dependent methyltransferase
MKREAPAAARNREPIAAVLAEELPASGTVLEIASGTGEHAIHFAARFPHLTWQPSDPDAEARESIAAWAVDSGLANLAPPLAIDAASARWPVSDVAALVCINMVHISPIAASEGLLRMAGRLLPPGAPLVFYGPWIEEGVETAPSNVAFDDSLKARNPSWGLRAVAWMESLAASQGLSRTRRVAMPANNIMLVYRKD